jgi:hypothetical protein
VSVTLTPQKIATAEEYRNGALQSITVKQNTGLKLSREAKTLALFFGIKLTK